MRDKRQIDMGFSGRRVFVTGAASGIGAATVEHFRTEGANVFGVDIVAHAGGRQCDVSDEASVTAAMDDAMTALGGLDICVNVAGVNLMQRFEAITVELADNPGRGTRSSSMTA